MDERDDLTSGETIGTCEQCGARTPWSRLESRNIQRRVSALRLSDDSWVRDALILAWFAISIPRFFLHPFHVFGEGRLATTELCPECSEQYTRKMRLTYRAMGAGVAVYATLAVVLLTWAFSRMYPG